MGTQQFYKHRSAFGFAGRGADHHALQDYEREKVTRGGLAGLVQKISQTD